LAADAKRAIPCRASATATDDVATPFTLLETDDHDDDRAA
jgi:hypothetical protein